MLDLKIWKKLWSKAPMQCKLQVYQNLIHMFCCKCIHLVEDGQTPKLLDYGYVQFYMQLWSWQGTPLYSAVEEPTILLFPASACYPVIQGLEVWAHEQMSGHLRVLFFIKTKLSHIICSTYVTERLFCSCSMSKIWIL